MALNFSAPNFVQPQDFNGIPRSIDQLFASYQQAKQNSIQNQLAGSQLQSNQLAQLGSRAQLAGIGINPNQDLNAQYDQLMRQHFENRQLNTERIKQENEKLKQEAEQSKAHAAYFNWMAGGPGGNTSANEAAQALLENRIAPSQLPGFGQNSLRARALALAFQKNPTFDVQSAETGFTRKQGIARFDTSGAVQTPIRLINSVLPNLDELVSLSRRIGNGPLKIVNRAKIEAMKQTGSIDAARYLTVATDTADQLSKIFSGNGTNSDNKIGQALGVLSSDYSPQQLEGVVEELKKMASSRKEALLGKSSSITPAKPASSKYGHLSNEQILEAIKNAR